MAKTLRKTKFVVILQNKTDSRDDEWVSVWAENKKAAIRQVEKDGFNNHRFHLGEALTAKEFKKVFGFRVG